MSQPKPETLNEARARMLLQIAVGVAWYLEVTPAANADDVLASAKQLVRTMKASPPSECPPAPEAVFNDELAELDATARILLDEARQQIAELEQELVAYRAQQPDTYDLNMLQAFIGANGTSQHQASLRLLLAKVKQVASPPKEDQS